MALQVSEAQGNYPFHIRKAGWLHALPVLMMSLNDVIWHGLQLPVSQAQQWRRHIAWPPYHVSWSRGSSDGESW